MKKLIISMMLLICAVSLNAQVDSIKLIAPGILTEANMIVNTSSNISYLRTLNWVNKTYKNPDKVLTGKVEGKSVTISGYSDNASYSKGMVTQFYDISYHLYITIIDSSINFNLVIDKLYYNGNPSINGVSGFFNKKGEYKLSLMNVAKETLEHTINDLLFSYYNSLQNIEITSDEAITELKKFKDKLDLELITQEEYNAKKLELSKYIK